MLVFFLFYLIIKDLKIRADFVVTGISYIHMGVGQQLPLSGEK